MVVDHRDEVCMLGHRNLFDVGVAGLGGVNLCHELVVTVYVVGERCGIVVLHADICDVVEHEHELVV